MFPKLEMWISNHNTKVLEIPYFILSKCVILKLLKILLILNEHFRIHPNKILLSFCRNFPLPLYRVTRKHAFIRVCRTLPLVDWHWTPSVCTSYISLYWFFCICSIFFALSSCLIIFVFYCSFVVCLIKIHLSESSSLVSSAIKIS